MSIQTIIDSAQSIEIDRRKVVAQTMSRSQRIKIAERASAQPWKFTVTPPGSLRWSDNRDTVELIDYNDRSQEYTISLNNNSRMNYITEYRGQLTTGQLAALTVTNFTTATMVVGGLPSVSTSTVIFAQGDLIQPINSRYPYTVVNTVYRGSGVNVTVTTNRPAITSEGISLLTNLKVGNSCTWAVVVTALPSYTIVPKNRLQFNGNFELVEKIV